MFDPLINTIIAESLAMVVLTVLVIILLSRRKEREKHIYVLSRATDVEDLKKTVEHLQLERRRLEHKPVGKIAFIFLLIGAVALVSAVVFVSSILAFVGLGLSFWGALLLFIRPVSYVRQELLNSSIVSSLLVIDRILTNLNYQGKGVYLPPASLRGLKEGMMFISTNKEVVIPPVEQVSQEKYFSNPHGIFLVPLGQGLLSLFEKKLGTDFSKTDLDYLKANLPKLLIEDLEILEDLKINVDGGMIHVKMVKSVYSNLCQELEKTSKVCSNIGCPLCSSIACALAKATSKAVVIERNEFVQKEKAIETWYRIIGA